MRRRVDDVWAILLRDLELSSIEQAEAAIDPYLQGSPPREPLPPGVQRRQPLWDTNGVEPSEVFMSLGQRPRHVGAWILNQLYLSMPRPDPNWARDCQTENFHTRLWEAYLLACCREQGLRVEQRYSSPDFHVSNRAGGEAWIEAVTANPTVRYEHYGASPTNAPEDRAEKFIGAAAVRFAKAI